MVDVCSLALVKDSNSWPAGGSRAPSDAFADASCVPASLAAGGQANLSLAQADFQSSARDPLNVFPTGNIASVDFGPPFPASPAEVSASMVKPPFLGASLCLSDPTVPFGVPSDSIILPASHFFLPGAHEHGQQSMGRASSKAKARIECAYDGLSVGLLVSFVTALCIGILLASGSADEHQSSSKPDLRTSAEQAGARDSFINRKIIFHVKLMHQRIIVGFPPAFAEAFPVIWHTESLFSATINCDDGEGSFTPTTQCVHFYQGMDDRQTLYYKQLSAITIRIKQNWRAVLHLPPAFLLVHKDFHGLQVPAIASSTASQMPSKCVCDETNCVDCALATTRTFLFAFYCSNNQFDYCASSRYCYYLRSNALKYEKQYTTVCVYTGTKWFLLLSKRAAFEPLDDEKFTSFAISNCIAPQPQRVFLFSSKSSMPPHRSFFILRDANDLTRIVVFCKRASRCLRIKSSDTDCSTEAVTNVWHSYISRVDPYRLYIDCRLVLHHNYFVVEISRYISLIERFSHAVEVCYPSNSNDAILSLSLFTSIAAGKISFTEFLLSNSENVHFSLCAKTNFVGKTNFDCFYCLQISRINLFDAFGTNVAITGSCYSVSRHLSYCNVLIRCFFVDSKKYEHLVLSSNFRTLDENATRGNCFEKAADQNTAVFTFDPGHNDFSRSSMCWKQNDYFRSVTAHTAYVHSFRLLGTIYELYSESFSPKSSSVAQHPLRIFSRLSKSSSKNFSFTVLALLDVKHIFGVLFIFVVLKYSVILALSIMFGKVMNVLLVGRTSRPFSRFVTSSSPSLLCHLCNAAESTSIAKSKYSVPGNCLQCKHNQTRFFNVEQGVSLAKNRIVLFPLYSTLQNLRVKSFLACWRRFLFSSATVVDADDGVDANLDDASCFSFLESAIMFFSAHGSKLHSILFLWPPIVLNCVHLLIGYFRDDQTILTQPRLQRNIICTAITLCILTSPFCVNGQTSVIMTLTRIICQMHY
jgi:hypothetical protein